MFIYMSARNSLDVVTRNCDSVGFTRTSTGTVGLSYLLSK